jgi:hypothetical protein
MRVARVVPVRKEGQLKPEHHNQRFPIILNGAAALQEFTKIKAQKSAPLPGSGDGASRIIGAAHSFWPA